MDQDMLTYLVLGVVGILLIVLFGMRRRKARKKALESLPKTEPWSPPEFTNPAREYTVNGVRYTYLGSSRVAGHEYRNQQTGKFIHFTQLWKSLSRKDKDAYMEENPTYRPE